MVIQVRPRKIGGYGWRRDLPDHRDRRLLLRPQMLPARVDLSDQCPPVYDQGDLGSCTANAIAAALEFDLQKQNPGVAPFVPSRLFIYYNERVIEGTTDSDAGAEIRDGAKSVGSAGVCPEDQWPYDIARFTEVPPGECYDEAKHDLATNYYSLFQENDTLRGCLAEGFPVVFGFSVYESFESDQVARTGTVPLPRASESLLGGHAVLIVGYDDMDKRFMVRNSWGPDWGDKGYFTMPYDYVLDPALASDFWTLRRYAVNTGIVPDLSA